MGIALSTLVVMGALCFAMDLFLRRAMDLGEQQGLRAQTEAVQASVKQGLQVTVEGFRSKTSDKVANARTVKLPDGRQVFAGSSFDPGNPAQ